MKSNIVLVLLAVGVASGCQKRRPDPAVRPQSSAPGVKAQDAEASNPAAAEVDAFGNATDPAKALRTSTVKDLVWKRYRAVERTLMRDLALPQSEICNELGTFSCIDSVFLSTLGGNNAIESSQFVPAERPTVATPVALDRVVLSACVRRVELDKQAGPAAAHVFPGFPLSSSSLDLNDENIRSKARGQVVSLYRRLLSRDPLVSEQDLVLELAQGASATEFAKAACYVIGTSVEFLFI